MAHCNDGDSEISNNFSLGPRIKRKHPGETDIMSFVLLSKVRKTDPSSKANVCKECNKAFSSFSNLRFHVKKKHLDKLNELAPIEVKNHKCSSCDAEFQVLQRLIEHKKSHSTPVTYQCPLCQYLGASTDILITHYREEHNLEINLEKLKFESFKHFEQWKSTMEKETFALFVKVRGSTKNANYTKIDYRCHRSGDYKCEGNNIRKLKTQGSNKIGGLCPAKISVIITNDDKCEVTFCGNHVGHQQQEDLGHLSISKVDRENIAAKIASKIPLESILNEMRDSVSNCPIDRLHLLNKKDLYNIESSSKFSGSSVRHQNDADSPKSNQDEEIESETNLVLMDIEIKDEEIPALEELMTISTERPSTQYDLQQQIQQEQQDILQSFQQELFASKSSEELEVFRNILAPLKPTLNAVRNQQ